MGASSVQLRIWGVGIATSMLVAAAGASMAPARLGQAGSPAALTSGMTRGDVQPLRSAEPSGASATRPARFEDRLLQNAPPAAGATR